MKRLIRKTAFDKSQFDEEQLKVIERADNLYIPFDLFSHPNLSADWMSYILDRCEELKYIDGEDSDGDFSYYYSIIEEMLTPEDLDFSTNAEEKAEEIAEKIDNIADVLSSREHHDNQNRTCAITYINGRFHETEAHAIALNRFLHSTTNQVFDNPWMRPTKEEVEEKINKKDTIFLAHKVDGGMLQSDGTGITKAIYLMNEPIWLQNITIEEAAEKLKEKYSDFDIYLDDQSKIDYKQMKRVFPKLARLKKRMNQYKMKKYSEDITNQQDQLVNYLELKEYEIINWMKKYKDKVYELIKKMIDDGNIPSYTIYRDALDLDPNVIVLLLDAGVDLAPIFKLNAVEKNPELIHVIDKSDEDAETKLKKLKEKIDKNKRKWEFDRNSIKVRKPWHDIDYRSAAILYVEKNGVGKIFTEHSHNSAVNYAITFFNEELNKRKHGDLRRYDLDEVFGPDTIFFHAHLVDSSFSQINNFGDRDLTGKDKCIYIMPDPQLRQNIDIDGIIKILQEYYPGYEIYDDNDWEIDYDNYLIKYKRLAKLKNTTKLTRKSFTLQV